MQLFSLKTDEDPENEHFQVEVKASTLLKSEEDKEKGNYDVYLNDDLCCWKELKIPFDLKVFNFHNYVKSSG